MTVTAVQLQPVDNVACVLRDHLAGEKPSLADTPAPTLVSNIPMGHKFALVTIPEGSAVVKFGAVIGHASCTITAGEHVHSHNLRGSPL